jgi:branched-chain amino acid transport system substrate-binding protein
VRLIYDEGAVGVIGALDGRAAHLAEQVITRARGAAVFVTPWASEATLTRIRVPWFFRMVPDDRQQAVVLAREIFALRALQRVAVWIDDGFDSRSAAAAFRRVAPAGAVEEFTAEFSGTTEEFASEAPGALQLLSERVATGDIDAVVLFAGAESAAAVVVALRSADRVLPLFGPLALARPGFLDATGIEGEAIALIAPAEVAAGRFGFDRLYRKAHGVAPTLPALYGHDAATALIEAMRAAGMESGDRIAAALTGLSFAGVTGEVRFNDQGGRDMMPALPTARRRTPVAGCSGDDSTGR